MQEILDGLKGLGSKIDSQKTQIEKEITELKSASEKESLTFKEDVKKLNETLAAKDATILDIQNEVKELKAKGGRFKSGESKSVGLRQAIQMGIEDAIMSQKGKIMESEKGGMIGKIDIKAVANISSANLSGDNYVSYLDWRAGMEPTGQFHFRNLVRTILSETDFVQFPRANTPRGEGTFARQATEGAAKNQVDRDYTMINLTLKPMAAYSIVSRQSLRNITFLQSYLPTSMMDQMEIAEDDDFSATLVAGATGSTTTTRTLIGEKMITYLKTLIKAGYNPNGIAVDPDIWEELLVTRPGTAGETYSQPFVTSVLPNGNITILGRPVYPVNWLTGGRVVVGDWTKAAIVQSEGLTMRQSDSHASIFTSNEVAFLLERTENLAIFRPDAFITADLIA